MRQIKQFFLERDSPTLSLLQPKQEGIILIPERNYEITKIFEKNLLAIEMKKSTQILLKKNCLFRSINTGNKQNSNFSVLLWLCETKIWKKAKCYIDTDSFIVYINLKDIYKDI